MPKKHTTLSSHWLDEQQEYLLAIISKKLGSEDYHALDDVWQELRIAVEKVKEPESIDSPGAWIRQVINNKVADYLRIKQRSEKLKKHFISSMDSPISSLPYDWVLMLEDRSEVRNALTECSSESRNLLKLKYFSEFSVNHIATILKITPKAVEYRLHKAREEFRIHINKLRETP